MLIEKNRWPVATDLLDPSLHIDLDKLAAEVSAALARHPNSTNVVLYGACHPQMDALVQGAGALRVRGQNCVEMLLGTSTFTEELSQGAFFLLEDWARRWTDIITSTFGTNWDVIREIFQGDRQYLLCLRTPCAGDFRAEAEEAGRSIGLPVRWRDVSLEHFESVLAEAVTRGQEEAVCPR